MFAYIGGLDVSDVIILDLNQVDDNIDLISITADQPFTTTDDAIIGTASTEDVLLRREAADILNIASDSGLDELVHFLGSDSSCDSDLRQYKSSCIGTSGFPHSFHGFRCGQSIWLGLCAHH